MPALPAADLQDGVPVEVELADGPVLLLLLLGGTVYATEGLCPHKFATLADGTVRGDCLTCPLHEAAFDLRTGESDEPWAGRLQIYATRVRDDRVEVALPTSASPTP